MPLRKVPGMQIPTFIIASDSRCNDIEYNSQALEPILSSPAQEAAQDDCDQTGNRNGCEGLYSSAHFFMAPDHP